MQRAKRRTSINLVLCGAPAKKVPEPPVSHDDPNQSSLLKAIDSIVAAGRGGLLGPTARAAAEAVPDVDGKAGPETPSPLPLVEETPGEEEEEKALPDADLGGSDGEASQETPSPVEEKKEKKKKEPSMSMSDVYTGRWTSDKIEIWIFGDSAISVLMKRAQKNNYLMQLGIPSCFTCISWQGFPDMMWNDLLPCLHKVYHQRPFPSIIIIHLGEKDLWIDSSSLLVTKMQNDLGVLQRALPDVVLIWSSLLPKPVCKTPVKLKEIECKRSHVNSKMEEYCTNKGIYCLSHPLFTAENKELFLPYRNALSNEGADIFETDLTEILHTILS